VAKKPMESPSGRKKTKRRKREITEEEPLEMSEEMEPEGVSCAQQ
jgi:hypothetical protein